MRTDAMAPPNGAETESGRPRISPRARKTARELEIDLSLIRGSGPEGRVVEADVLRFAEENRGEAAPSDGGSARERITPAARRLAAERGISLGGIAGTGPGGRVTREDVLAALTATPPGPRHREEPEPPTGAPVLAPGVAAALPRSVAVEMGLTGRIVPLSRKRKVTAQKMSLSARTVARITLALEVDMAEATRLRRELLPLYEAQHGVRLSYTDLLVLAVARALREHPQLNSRWTDQGILLIDQINIGVATAVDDGLIVPVVSGAADKTLAEIARITTDLANRARDGKLSLVEMSGSTFTISNLGMYGIELFTPIVNPPEAAILGVGTIVEKPVVREGQVVVRPRMALCLSADHRVVDGAPAAQFLRRVRQLLEMPYLLL